MSKTVAQIVAEYMESLDRQRRHLGMTEELFFSVEVLTSNRFARVPDRKWNTTPDPPLGKKDKT